MIGCDDEVTRIREGFGQKTRLRRAGVEAVRKHDDRQWLVRIRFGRPDDRVDIAESKRLLMRRIGQRRECRELQSARASRKRVKHCARDGRAAVIGRASLR
jgi:hypothetical protein